MGQIKNEEKITLGSGCFWCNEAIFQRLKGVIKVESGYSGGQSVNPTYEDVCSGKTGHAEVIQLTFNPQEISIFEILEVFFKTHDPTTLNRQGADVGTQYRSVIYYHSTEQQQIALQLIDELNTEKIWPDPIVTKVEMIQPFYKAESYHQNYFNENMNQGYCRFVIVPKLEKFEKIFSDKILK
ncbi:MAG: peptide-methionine (S)-S-oxide reductase MsrA [Bacteroidales bacterium]|nr:peptide-methionine (S)-S-oxide reductase MsrA [Bacteroidales bacterium]